MKKHHTLLLVLPLFLLFSSSMLCPAMTTARKSGIENEEWGYVKVREKAHLFWWHYKSPHRVKDSSTPWPIILWLQGGPGVSGIAYGNFYQVGPRNENLSLRKSTWLQKADLLFVDSPVGTGFSYVEDEQWVARTDEEIATDLIALLKELFDKNEALRKSPLFIFGETYGGKTAVILGLEVLKSIEAKQLDLTLGGVALGHGWISPQDFVLSWGPLLKDMSRLDDIGLEEANRLAVQIQNQLANRDSMDATDTFIKLEKVIGHHSNKVNLNNFLFDDGQPTTPPNFTEFMNGAIKTRLQIIPKGVKWGAQENLVFPALKGEFMKPKIEEVGMLLNKGVHVTIYNGQLDVRCSTKGVESWLEKLQWDGKETFLNMDRVPMYYGTDKETKGFKISHRNLTFYWILNAGHLIPREQPWITLNMVAEMTSSPRTSDGNIAELEAENEEAKSKGERNELEFEGFDGSEAEPGRGSREKHGPSLWKNYDWHV